MTYRIGVDTGGTFVDVVVDDASGGLRLTKSLADPADRAGAVVRGLADAAEREGLTLQQLLEQTERIVHGSTVATNALLTREGASVALLTTEGFRDVLNMRRGMRDRPMDSRRPPPEPLVPRSAILGVAERVEADGSVSLPLEADALHGAVRFLDGKDIDGVAVCLTFSFRDPRHEAALRDAIRGRYPAMHISLSSEVLPQIGLYERVSTTAVNAFVSPLLGSYLTSVVDALARNGFRGGFLVMHSNGGVASADTARRFGVRSVLSGPAAGPVAASASAALYGLRNAISIDMGGTSFDVCLIDGGSPNITSDGELAGHRIALPMVDIHTIGAGGGSIVSVDERGLLTVGPRSAGAQPGPACYGEGGTEPTVTDAVLLLGLIAPERFWGGRLSLDVRAAEHAMRERVAERLGIDTIRAAYGAYHVVNENMVDAIREVSVRRGYDPRQFVLVAAGGAGPVHVGALADELEIPLVLVPRLASVFCALGGLLSDLRYEASTSMVAPLASLDTGAANAVVERLRGQIEDSLRADGVAIAHGRSTTYADIRYVGQFHEIEIDVPDGAFSPQSTTQVAQAFHARHEVVNGYHEPSHALEVINLRVVTTVPTDRPRPSGAGLESGGPAGGTQHAHRGERTIHWGGDPSSFAVYERSALRPADTISGPAIIEEETTTLIVPPSFDLRCDRFGNGLMYRKGNDLEALLERLAGPGRVAVHA
jgi:N-methylhydantoinase A